MPSLPLVLPAHRERPIALRHGKHVLVSEFLRHVDAIVRSLPAGASMINLCEDRYHFLAAYAAALSVGHSVLLPASRAEKVVSELSASRPDSYRYDDAMVAAAMSAVRDQANVNTSIPANQTVMIGFTSGSTGQPKTFPKLWRTVSGSTAQNAHAIRDALGLASSDVTPWIVATVPPQHMYGMELSILLPLIGGM